MLYYKDKLTKEDILNLKKGDIMRMKGTVRGVDDYLVVSDLRIDNSDERYSVINGTLVELHRRPNSVGIEYVVKNAIDMVRLGD